MHIFPNGQANISLKRTSSNDPGFIALVRRLDAELAERDGEDHAFYARFNTIDRIRHVVLAMEGEQGLGCGAIKAFDDHSMEVKRMYVMPEARQRGIASRVLATLEDWAREMGYTRTVLETGSRQTEAVALYDRNGYARIPNYGQYIGVTNSICFEKQLL
jgi:GNAT superfamily N-acetyltransferase